MERVLTIRTTAVEAFRLWYYGQTESNAMWNTEEKVIATIKGVYEANIKADYGTAGHAIIEDAKKCKQVKGYRHGAFWFTDKQAEPILRYAAEHPYMMREISLSKAHTVGGITLIITGTTDAIEGCQLRDTKFKFSAIDVAEYMDSIQWRLYLDMLGLKYFWYDIFPVKYFDELSDVPKSVIGEVESFLCTPYPEMVNDIQGILTEFMQWISFKNLEQYLAIDNAKARKILAGNPSLRNLITV
jgi:hypothetical protein